MSTTTAPVPGAVIWRMFRPHTLTAAFAPVFLGTAFAVQQTDLKVDTFIAMLIACILIQAATNMFNEYFDFKRGLDHADSIGISGSIVRDGLTPRTVLYSALGALFVAMLLGLYLCARTSWLLLPVGLVCVLIGYLYSGGPYPLSAGPLGEIFSGFTMGTVIIVISYFLQTGAVTAEAFIVSVPTAVLIGAILTANNIRDIDDDTRHGRRTLVILLGRSRGVRMLTAMLAFSYIFLIGMILSGMVTVWSLFAFISLPIALKGVRTFNRYRLQKEMMPAMICIAKTNTIFGLGMASGMVLKLIL